MAPLNEKQLNLALVCRTRSEKLTEEAQLTSELRQYWSRIRARYPLVTDSEMVPGYLPELDALIASGVPSDLCPCEPMVNTVTGGVDEETRQSCTSTLSDTSQDITSNAVDTATVPDVALHALSEPPRTETAVVSTEPHSVVSVLQNTPVESAAQSSSSLPNSDAVIKVSESPPRVRFKIKFYNSL